MHNELGLIKLRFPCLCLLLAMLVACADIRPAPVAADIVIRDVTVIDALSGVRSHQDVAIAGDRITVVAQHPVRVVAPATEIDGSDHFLIPGLWDAHVHLTFLPNSAEPMLNLFSAHGITRVRDTGGPLAATLNAVATAKRMGPNAPEIYFAGPLLDGKDVVYNGEAPGYPTMARAVTTESEAREAIATLAAAGARFVKVYEMLDPDVMQALVLAANDAGLPVASHIPLAMNPMAYLASGVNSLEHFRNLELACALNFDELLAERRALLTNPDMLPGRTLRSSIHAAQRERAVDNYSPERCDEVMAAIVSHNVVQGPTLALNEAVFARSYGAATVQSTFDLLPQALGDEWRGRAKFLSGPDSPFKGSEARNAKQLDWIRSLVRALNQRNARFIAGTDTPIFFMTPGASLHSELQAFVTAGLSPLEALKAATLAPAAFFGEADRLGHVSAGAIADLVLLSADPLRDIRNVGQIEAVIQQGNLKTRAMLDAQILRSQRFVATP